MTLTLTQSQKGLSLDVAYCIVPLYDVCEGNSLRDMTIRSFFMTFVALIFACDLHRPSRSLSFLSLDGRYAVMYCFQVRSL